MLNYNIKGTGLEVTPEIRGYVEKQLSHAEKFLLGDSTAHVEVELEHTPARHSEGEGKITDQKYRAEFTVRASGEVYRAEHWGSTLHEAVDIASAEVAKELRTQKKRKLRTFRHSASRVKEYLRGWRDKI